MKHTYELTIKFSSTKPIKKHADALIQFENGLGYFVECTNGNGYVNHINETFVYGTGKTSLKKLTAPKRSTARKHSGKRKKRK